MSLVIDEGVLSAAGELLLGPRSLPIDVQITVEWLRGIEQPTWYGYFTPHYGLSMLPGLYSVRVAGTEYRILLRRQPESSIPGALPFWGIGDPPPVPPRERDVNEPDPDGTRGIGQAGPHPS